LLATRTSDRIGKGIRSTPRDAMIADSTPPRQLGWAFGFARAMDHLGAAVGPLAAALFLYFCPNQLRSLFLWTALPGLAVVLLVTLGLREEPVQQKAERPKFTLHFGPLGSNFRLYLLAMFVFTLGNSSDAFLLSRARELGMSNGWLPILWLAIHLVKSGGSVLAGLSVNRAGTKPLIFAGWTIYALVYTGFAFASQVWHVWVLFLIYGVYYALTEPVEKKFVADLVGPQRKGLAYGWFNFSIGIGALPASLLFGWLDDRFGPATAFGCGAALAAVAAVLLARVKNKPNGEVGMGK
jgi:MFS family permease